METQITGAAIPAQNMTQPRSEYVVPTTDDRARPRFVFFAGDCVTPSEKYSSPQMSFGGIHLNTFQTLKKSDFMVYRCAITEVKTVMRDENPNMVAPSNRRNYQKSYVERNGHFDAATGKYIDLVVDGATTGKIYDYVYPGDEIAAITRASNGLEPGGVVELTPLIGKDDDFRARAQYHFFPNWDDIQQAKIKLPRTIPELRAHIQSRISQTESNGLQQVGREMIRSCDEFAAWGVRYVNQATDRIERAKNMTDAPAGSTVYNELAEMLIEMLGIVRKDAMLNELHASQIRLANTGGGNGSMSAEEISLKERELKIREEELEMKRAEFKLRETPPVSGGTKKLSLEKTICPMVTQSGEPCKSYVAAGLSLCSVHTKQAEDAAAKIQ